MDSFAFAVAYSLIQKLNFDSSGTSLLPVYLEDDFQLLIVGGYMRADLAQTCKALKNDPRMFPNLQIRDRVFI